MTSVLLDTGVIVALLDRREKHHRQCVDVLSDLSCNLITCASVITEACYLLRRISGAPAAVLANVRERVFDLPFRLSDRADAVGKIMTKYSDVPADLADAWLVDLADQANTGRILTLNSDFEVYRWRGRRRFELLIES